MNLASFLSSITRLKQGSTAYGLAPHKPILLLTILDLFDRGVITDNRVFINGELVSAFHENWDILAKEGFIEDFTLPFYYLQNDKIAGAPFWFLKTIPGFQITKHIRSIQTLSEVVEYACFSNSVFQIMTFKENRDEIRKTLINYYFHGSFEHYFQAIREQGSYLKEVQQYVLNEVPKVMRLKAAEAEMVYVRSWTFKKVVPKIYAHTCAISELKLQSFTGNTLIDACHIVPFSKEQDDHISNGIALCPNLHRAFDAGLVTIDSEFKVVISTSIKEDINHPYALSKLAGKRIHLPNEKRQWPSQERLEWHRSKRFIG